MSRRRNQPKAQVFPAEGQFYSNDLCAAVAAAMLRDFRTNNFMFPGFPAVSLKKRAKLPQARVHDLKHTFGQRLRAAGVSFEDRQDLLGHKSGRMTTHYSAAELSNLIEAAEKACRLGSRKSPAAVALKQKAAGALAPTA